MKHTVAIIGAGEPDGSILSLLFARSESRLLLSDKDPQRARGVLTELRRTNAQAEAEILDCARTSCWEADIIVIATPSSSRDEVLEKIREVSTGKIVAAVVSSRSAGDLYARSLPHSRFVRLVCAGYGYTLSGDDEDALETVRRLMDRSGSAAPPVRLSSGRHGSAHN
jgi:predicted dinucleotide-binding enzyme